MLNIRMSRTPIEGSPVPGCLTPRRAHLGCGRGSSPAMAPDSPSRLWEAQNFVRHRGAARER